MNKKELSEYLSEIGKKGGKNGTGAAKRRSPEHYQKMVQAKKEKALARAGEKWVEAVN